VKLPSIAIRWLLAQLPTVWLAAELKRRQLNRRRKKDENILK
jgi:hypothetical protein